MSKPRVLFLDDDDVNLLTFGALLDDAGYDVVSRSTVPDARRTANTERFDLAVLDVHVGDQLGTQLIPELRALFPRIIIVVLSGSMTERNVAGADLVLPKADDPGEALAAIARVRAR